MWMYMYTVHCSSFGSRTAAYMPTSARLGPDDAREQLENIETSDEASVFPSCLTLPYHTAGNF